MGGRRLCWLLLPVLVLLCSCAGITPDTGSLRDHREEGPESGLFSGADGEFVIIVPAGGKTAREQENEPAPGE